ncbi:hypothetical protein [Neptuniibacter halophilus]|uniref:hypothetical protein n=1 Tax=Neptuniibacter halophilus TaxID=651666 RepID=UPI002572CECD|nr:hypothetical protein [Neptuniibacter halophilus]
MTSKGMYENCACRKLEGEPDGSVKLTLLSSIPNQRIYRCCNCHSFLSFAEDNQTWEVLLQGDLDTELRNLYEVESTRETGT